MARVRERQGDEEEAEDPAEEEEEEASERMEARLNNLSIDMAGTGEEATRGLAAALEM